MTAITTFPNGRYRPEAVATEAPHADVFQLFNTNGGLLRVYIQECRIAARMAGRASRLQIGMLVVHRVARFKVRRQRHRRRNLETGLRSGLPGQKTLLCHVNGDVATRCLTSTAHIARDIELRSPML